MLRGLGKEIPRMRLSMTETQRIELEVAAAAEQNVRRWRRSQAVLVPAEGQAPGAIVHTRPHAALQPCQGRPLGSGLAAGGGGGRREGNHGGGRCKVDAAGEAMLTPLLATDPQTRGHQATGWTVPLLRPERARAGAAVAPKTARRALHRLGYRWKRPQDVLGRPDPADDEKKGPASPSRRRCWPPMGRSGWSTRRPCAKSRRYGRGGADAASRRWC